MGGEIRIGEPRVELRREKKWGGNILGKLRGGENWEKRRRKVKKIKGKRMSGGEILKKRKGKEKYLGKISKSGKILKISEKPEK